MNAENWPFYVEPMRLADIPTVSIIERLVYTRPWPVEAYRYELVENPHSYYYIARLKGQRASNTSSGFKAAIRRAISGPDIDQTLLGYAGLWLMVDEAHISTLAVHSAWQGHGIGELLLATLVEKSIELEATCVTLEVRISNLRAQSLYRKYGFKQVGTRRKYYSDNNEDALIMTTDPVCSPSYQRFFQALVNNLDTKMLMQAARLSAAQADGETA